MKKANSKSSLSNEISLKKPPRRLYYQQGQLHFATSLLSDLVAQHNTPLYVYSKSIIEAQIQKYLEAFDRQAHIYFALKSNFHPDVLKIMKNHNFGVDVVSLGEIKQAFAVGFSPRDVIFSGVAKSGEELTFAIEHNIKQINVESPQELDVIGQITERVRKPASVAFRYNPDVDAKTHPHITTGFKENKFGMHACFLPELEQILRKYPLVSLRGITIHIGSQILDISVFKEAISKTIPVYQHFRRLGFEMGRFDVGGGLGISYHKGQKSPDLSSYGKIVLESLAPLSCQILCEPGRILVGPAGVLLTRVLYTKNTPFKNFAMVDTGMHHLLRPVLYQAHHEILPLEEEQRGHKVQVYDIVGPICESADVLGRARLLKELERGDFLAIRDVGAYGAVMASGYNSHRPPKEILIP